LYQGQRTCADKLPPLLLNSERQRRSSAAPRSYQRNKLEPKQELTEDDSIKRTRKIDDGGSSRNVLAVLARWYANVRTLSLVV
jgi:hypothetical protein